MEDHPDWELQFGTKVLEALFFGQIWKPYKAPPQISKHSLSLALVESGSQSGADVAPMPRGTVIIRVKEASGKNRAGETVWDESFTEGYIRAEMRSENGTKIVVSFHDHRQ